MNPFEKGGDDGDLIATTSNDQLQGFGFPLTRSRAKHMKGTLQVSISDIQNTVEFKVI